MSVAIVPNPPVSWDIYWTGPWVNASALFQAGVFEDQFITTYSPDRSGVSNPRSVWGYAQGGTGATGSAIRYFGSPVIERSTTVVPSVRGMNGVAFSTLQDRTQIASGYVNPSAMRVNWLSFNAAMDVGTLDRNSGIILTSSGGPQTAQLWPIAPSISFGTGFGIVGDGAGNWNFESFSGTPPATVLESVSLAPFIADPSELTTFDYVMIGCTGQRPASFELRINQVTALQRNWETGTVLPFMPTLATRWTVNLQVATPSGDRILFGQWEWKMGRFLPDGQELFE